MKLQKGMILFFKNRQEKILKANNCRLTGNIITENQTYSTDFVMRWIELKFIKVKND